MSIFTRLNVLVAAAIMLIMGFIFVLGGLSDEKDALIIEYREVARHENIANRLQANLLQKRVNLLLYATSGKQQFINKIAKNDELITQFTKDARANSIASDAELTQIEADLVSYKTAQAIYLSNLAAIVLHASQAADSLKGLHAHNNARDEQLHGLIAEQLQSFITNPRSFEFIQPLIAAFERDLANDYHFKADEPDLNEKIRQNLHQIELSVARARQASVTLSSIGTPLSNTIENLKLELKKRQDTLGPQLKEKIATTEQLTTTAVVIIAVIFIVIVIVARVKLLGPLQHAIANAKANLGALQIQNVRMLRTLDTTTTTTTTNTTTTTGKTDELQQLRIVSEEMGVVIDASEALLAAYKAQQHKITEQQKRVAIDNMLGGVSHNLNNFIQPITLLIGEVKTADKASEEYLQVISDSVQKMKTIIATLLASSRIQEDKLATRETLIEVIALAKIGLNKTQTLSLDMSRYVESGITVNLDELAFQTVMLNLFNNAVDAAVPERPLHIQVTPSVTQAEKMVTIEIKDNGTGMSPEVLARAKDKFFTTKEVSKGTGLGVSEVIDLVGRAGGSVEIDSTEHVGTTVTLHIPFVREEVEALA